MALIILSILFLLAVSLAFYFWLQWMMLTVHIVRTETPIPKPEQIDLCKKFVFNNIFQYIRMTAKALWISLKIRMLKVKG